MSDNQWHHQTIGMREKMDKLLAQITGDRNNFSMEHRCLNGVCFLTTVVLFISVALNYLIGLPFQMILVALFSCVIFGIAYYFCRFKKAFKAVYWLVLISVCTLVCLTWFNAGGISGPIALIALIVVSVINLVAKGKERILSLFTVILVTGLLFFLEYTYPGLIVAYQSRHIKYIDNYITFLIAVLIISFVIDFALSHYRTEREKSEEAKKQLKDSEAHFRLLVENAPDAIFIQTDGCFTYFNPATLKLFGAKTAKELIGEPVINRFHPDHREAIKKRIRRLNQEKEPIPHREETYLRMDGSTVYTEISAVPFKYQEKDGALVFVRDITEQKKADQHQKEIEKQLQQAQKMQAIGTLAGGIAHDFNNILSAIIGYTELSMSKVQKGTDLHKNLSSVLNAGNRASDLVKQILTLSRREEQEKKPTPIIPLIKEALKMLRSTIPTSVDFQENISSEHLIIHADATQIHQIIINLATNAVHAMKDREGVLKICVAPINFDRNTNKTYPDLSPGEYVRIMIKDTGVGIPKTHLDKIFEPYFTTKQKGVGTGLGLSIVHGIVKSHNGHISVRSEPGRGSTFEVYLPLSQWQAEDCGLQRDEQLQGGTEHILIVDDERNVLEVHQQSLQDLGYEVTAISDSLEALETFRSAPTQFDLVITDMAMPNLTGDKLARSIKTIRQDVPVILWTGFSEKSNDLLKDPSIGSILMKPVSYAKLAKTVRKVLDPAV
ncbi:MAG: ATP-binding protein [Desulfobacterales bacterium]|nr:ATP-binding protein [Desulfobacterales bacterium]